MGTKYSRDYNVDCIKGLWFTMMVIVHTGYYSLINPVAWEFFGVVTSAEFLVMCSGINTGTLYRKSIEKDQISFVVKKVLLRSFVIYAICLLNTLFILVFSNLLTSINFEYVTTYYGFNEVFNLFPLYDGQVNTIYDMIKGAVLLKYGPHQIQILGFYAIILMLSPIAIYCIKNNILLFIMTSAVIYQINSFYKVNITGAQFEQAFSFFSWQFLFFLSLACGYYKQEVLEKIQKNLNLKPYAYSLYAIAFTFFIMSHLNIRHNHNLIYEALFSKQYLGILRLFNAGILFICLYLLIEKNKNSLHKFINFFSRISKSMLFLFCIHIYVILLFHNLFKPIYNSSLLLQSVLQLLIIMSLYLCSVLKLKMNNIISAQ